MLSLRSYWGGLTKGEGYASEPDSDDDTVEKETVFINSRRDLRGRDFNKDRSPIPATDFENFSLD